jgi:hypothetical protein
MNETSHNPACLHCEARPASTWYGLCEVCDRIRALRRVYRVARGRTPEWEAHLLYLTDRAKRRVPLFEAGYTSPPRRSRGRRKGKRIRLRLPVVRRLRLPPRPHDE